MLPLSLDNPTSARASLAKDTVFDQRGLQAIRTLGPEQSPEAMREVAKKFEAMFVQEMLKSMRAGGEVFAQGNYFSSETERFHRDLYDQQLTLELSSGRGLGLAEHFYRNMQQQYGAYLADGSVKIPEYSGDGTLAQAPASSGELNEQVSHQQWGDSLRSLAPVVEDNAETRAENAFFNRYYAGTSIPSGVDAGTALGVGATKPAQRSYPAGDKQPVSQTQANFVALLKPHAEQAARALNVNPDVLIAQAALETGWGRHVIHTGQGHNSFNLFNIKASGQWQGDSVAVPTLEYDAGNPRYERASFRKYDSYGESFADYVRLMKTSARYQPALAAGKDSSAYAEALQQAGYATDPHYADKIKRLLNSEPINNLANTPLANNRLANAAAQITDAGLVAAGQLAKSLAGNLLSPTSLALTTSALHVTE